MELDPFFAVTDAVQVSTAAPAPAPNAQALEAEQSGASNDNATNPPQTMKDETAGTAGTDHRDDASPAANNPEAAPNNNPNNNINTEEEHAHLEPEHVVLSLLMKDKITEKECLLLRGVIEENNVLKQKIDKLKNLLARSAKANKDTSNELSTTKGKLEDANRTIQALTSKIEQLHNRPTHLDLLADFETNFDRAVLSLANTSDPQHQYQSGGEDPSSSQKRSSGLPFATNATTIQPEQPLEQSSSQDDTTPILTELQSRIAHLESINSALHHRTTKLEQHNQLLTEERDAAKSNLDDLQLELRLAKLETSDALRAIREKTIAISEMQMEIDLVTKASMDAIAKSKESLDRAEDAKSSKRHVQELEAKVEALQEWALASAEAKRLTMERAVALEKQLKTLQRSESQDSVHVVATSISSTGKERRLWTRSSSKVVGAGMVITQVIELGDCALSSSERVLLRWRFDVTPTDFDIDFAILKGKVTDPKKASIQSYLIDNRTVHGGAGGEVTGAFAVQNACTLEWSNKRSWVRPRAIKFTVEAFAITE